MQVKTEVRQKGPTGGAGVRVLTVPCLSGLRPPPRHARGDKDERQEGPRCSQQAPPGHAHQAG